MITQTDMEIGALQYHLQARLPNAFDLDNHDGESVALRRWGAAGRNLNCLEIIDDGTRDRGLEFTPALPSAGPISQGHPDWQALVQWRECIAEKRECIRSWIEIMAFYYSHHFVDVASTHPKWGIFYNQDALRRLALDIMDSSTRDPFLEAIMATPGLTAQELADMLVFPGAHPAPVYMRINSLANQGQVIIQQAQGQVYTYHAAPNANPALPQTKWIGPDDAARLAYELVRQHELYHFQTDMHATLMELVLNRPVYVNYHRLVYASIWPGSDCVEESLANKRMLAKAKNHVKDFARRWANQSPGAYGLWYQDKAPLLDRLNSQLQRNQSWANPIRPLEPWRLEEEVNLGFPCPEYMVRLSKGALTIDYNARPPRV